MGQGWVTDSAHMDTRATHFRTPTTVELDRLGDAAWRKFSKAHFPRSDRAARLTLSGYALIGIVVTTSVLYVIYRTLGEAFSGPAGPIPGWIQLSVLGGALVGACLVLAGWRMSRNRARPVVDPAPLPPITAEAAPRRLARMN